jgi:transketolase
MFAAHHRLDNLVATVDWNGQQIDGPTEKVMALGDLQAKFRAFGWKTVDMDGNDMDDVVRGLDEARSLTGKGSPVAILMRTRMGAGVDFMENDHAWHGIAPNDEQLQRALSQQPETLGDW